MGGLSGRPAVECQGPRICELHRSRNVKCGVRGPGIVLQRLTHRIVRYWRSARLRLTQCYRRDSRGTGRAQARNRPRETRARFGREVLGGVALIALLLRLEDKPLRLAPSSRGASAARQPSPLIRLPPILNLAARPPATAGLVPTLNPLRTRRDNP